jgi:endoglucanase
MRMSAFIVLMGLLCQASAQDLPVYENALQSGFVAGYSYGGGTDLQHAGTTHNASAFAIAFTGNNSNAVAFPHETVNFTTTQYSGLRFYVHGGGAGGQQLRFHIYNDLGGVSIANVEIDSFISGGAIAANEWSLVEIQFASAPLSFSGTFDRFDLQSDDPDTQATLYIDDVSLIDATPLSPDIFGNGFENGGPGPTGELRFSAPAYVVGEANALVTITVQRIGGSQGAASVDFATADLSATAPGDYTANNGTLMWANGDATDRTFDIAVVNDGLPEADETVALNLSNAQGAPLVVPSSAVLTIADPAPVAFRGTNITGMEMGYDFFPQATGPVGGKDYPVHDTRLIDYFAAKGMTTIRFLFSWEGMQSSLMGPIPAAPSGNYKLYFDRYKNIVDYATNVKGMQVIIEPWQANSSNGAGGPRWRGGLVGSAAVPTAAWIDFWTKFAGVYASNPRVAFGLVNEPNNMSTMGWWAIAQAGITAIRNAGATQRIYVPGNGYTAASTWVIGNAFYDSDPVKRSNAYGYLNANGVGVPINDPLNNLVVEVHTYLDNDEGGSTTGITSITAARQHLEVVVNEARAQGYKVYLGEIGFLATMPLAQAAWADFIDYFEANQDVLIGFSWFAGGAPGWWDDIGASGGGHFSITPTSGATFTGDTVNMDMIENDF